MVWMQTYCFYYSVRLGVIVAASVALFSVILQNLLAAINADVVVKAVIDALENDEYYNRQDSVRKVLDWFANYPDRFEICLYLWIVFYGIVCASAIYGAVKLSKWFLVPFICCDLLRCIGLLITHIVSMIILKKVLNLGVLIACTLIGSFILMLVVYNWASAVALFQIIQLINSEQYRLLYGDDPFAQSQISNLLMVTSVATINGVQNIKMFSTPNYEDVNIIKSLNIQRELDEAKLNDHVNNNEKGQTNKTENYYYNSDDFYNNWHSNELAGGKRRTKMYNRMYY